jgi:hypothetical protein
MFIINEQETIVNKNDILWCFEHYEEKLEKSRRFDYQVDIEGESLKFEEAGAYLIGLDLSGILLLKPKFDSYEKGIMGAMKIAHSARIVANPIRQHQG